MVDPVVPAGGDGEGEGFMGFMKGNGALIGMGIAAILAFMLGGPLIGFLALLLGGLAMAAMGGMFGEGVKDKADGALEAMGLREPEPKRDLPLEITLDPSDSKKSTVKIDGREYEVKLTTTSDNKSRGVVTKAEYRLAGSEDAFTELTLPPSENARLAGMIGENGFALDQKQFEANIANPLKKKVEADGRAAKKEMVVEGFHPIDKDGNAFAFQAGKETKAAYTVIVDKAARSLVINDATGKEITSVSGIDPAALVNGGPLNRNVAIALKKHAEDKTVEKPVAATIDPTKITLPAAANKIVDITTEQPKDHVSTGKFSLDGFETTFEMKQDAGKLQELTIIRNGRKINVAANNQLVGSFVEKDGAGHFVLEPEKLKPLLDAAIKKDDAEIAKYTAPLIKISEDKYLYNSRDRMYRVNITENSFSITDHKGNVIENGEGADIKGDKHAVMREAMHRIKDLNISPEAAAKSGTEGLAATEPSGRPYSPATDRDVTQRAIG